MPRSLLDHQNFRDRGRGDNQRTEQPVRDMPYCLQSIKTRIWAWDSTTKQILFCTLIWFVCSQGWESRHFLHSQQGDEYTHIYQTDDDLEHEHGLALYWSAISLIQSINPMKSLARSKVSE